MGARDAKRELIFLVLQQLCGVFDPPTNCLLFTVVSLLYFLSLDTRESKRFVRDSSARVHICPGKVLYLFLVYVVEADSCS